MWWSHGVVAAVVYTSVVVGIVGAFAAPSVMGEYQFECNDIRNCDEDSSAYKITKYNQDTNSSGATNCSGEMHLGRGLDDKTSGNYSLLLRTDARWRVLASGNFTSGCERTSEMLPEVFALLHLPASCPVASGNYYFKGEEVTGTRLSQFPKLPFGRFRLVVRMSHISEFNFTGCVLIDINLVPKDTIQREI